jgi:hypothetical protein
MLITRANVSSPALQKHRIKYKIEFPPGSMGLELEPVIKSAEREVGCRVKDFYFSIDHNGIDPNYLEARIAIGDVICSINGQDIRSMPFIQIIEKLRLLTDETRWITFKNITQSWVSKGGSICEALMDEPSLPTSPAPIFINPLLSRNKKKVSHRPPVPSSMVSPPFLSLPTPSKRKVTSIAIEEERKREKLEEEREEREESMTNENFENYSTGSNSSYGMGKAVLPSSSSPSPGDNFYVKYGESTGLRVSSLERKLSEEKVNEDGNNSKIQEKEGKQTNQSEVVPVMINLVSEKFLAKVGEGSGIASSSSFNAGSSATSSVMIAADQSSFLSLNSVLSSSNINNTHHRLPLPSPNRKDKKGKGSSSASPRLSHRPPSSPLKKPPVKFAVNVTSSHHPSDGITNLLYAEDREKEVKEEEIKKQNEELLRGKPPRYNDALVSTASPPSILIPVVVSPNIDNTPSDLASQTSLSPATPQQSLLATTAVNSAIVLGKAANTLSHVIDEGQHHLVESVFPSYTSKEYQELLQQKKTLLQELSQALLMLGEVQEEITSIKVLSTSLNHWPSSSSPFASPSASPLLLGLFSRDEREE